MYVYRVCGKRVASEEEIEPITVNASRQVEDRILGCCVRVTGSPAFSALLLRGGLYDSRHAFSFSLEAGTSVALSLAFSKSRVSIFLNEMTKMRND
jgi:hypothetical protein